MAEPGLDDARRRLPQGCQIEVPYDEGEWQDFLNCAIRGYRDGEWLDNEFYIKIESHGVEDRSVGRALRKSAVLVAYQHEGRGRIALWDGHGGGLLVIARESNGMIFNAFPVDDLLRYMRGMGNVRWLRR
jgi:hypothetical protein